ncbi:MAG: hypothetical protein ABI536_07580 [Gallionella sp.]
MHQHQPDTGDIMPITRANRIVLKYIKHIEMTGVLMRVFSFSLVSWMGPASPFMFVWIFNTTDAVMLSWCALLKKDAAYSTLNIFWVMVGIVGILRAGGWLH